MPTYIYYLNVLRTLVDLDLRKENYLIQIIE